MLIIEKSLKPNRFKDLDKASRKWAKSHAGLCVKRLLTREFAFELKNKDYTVQPMWEFVFDAIELIANTNEKLLVYVWDAVENCVYVNYKFYNASLSLYGVKKILNWNVKEDV